MMKKLLVIILPCITIAFSISIIHLSATRAFTERYIDLGQIQQLCTSATENHSITPDGKININTASAEVLTLLSGIGEVISQRIVEYRQANGPFESIDELINVKGIGIAKLEKIKNYIFVG